MADDRMRNDDLDRNMGGAGAGRQDQDYGQGGQKSPGRNKQDDDFSTGQKGASKQGEQQHMNDDFGNAGNKDAGHGDRDL